MASEWTVDGKKVAPGQLGKAFGDSLRKQIELNMKKAVNSVTCPDHGKSPSFENAGGEFKITGCCDKAVQLALKRLKN